MWWWCVCELETDSDVIQVTDRCYMPLWPTPKDRCGDGVFVCVCVCVCELETETDIIQVADRWNMALWPTPEDRRGDGAFVCVSWRPIVTSSGSPTGVTCPCDWRLRIDVAMMCKCVWAGVHTGTFVCASVFEDWWDTSRWRSDGRPCTRASNHVALRSNDITLRPWDTWRESRTSYSGIHQRVRMKVGG